MNERQKLGGAGMQKYWTKFRRIGLEWGGGERGGDNVATASTLFLPFPGQLDSRVASHRIVWHCGRFALFLLCSIEKFACQELCKAFAKRKRQSCREREREGRTDQGPRLQSGSKNNREKISFVSGKRFALFFRLDASFSASSFPHIGHTTNGKQKQKKRKNKRRKISLSIETIETIEDHLPGCCFCCCFRFSFSTRVSCQCRGGGAGERLLDCSTLHYSWR